MRFAPLFALAFAAACATAPPQAARPVETQAPQAGEASSLMRQIGRAGQADAPTLEWAERALGSADITRRDGAGAILTYRSDACGLVLVFVADRSNAMRLSAAEAQPPRLGETAPALDACVSAVQAQARAAS
ncbi:MAG: hypothetical protein AB7O04_12880 [Hyphomonadaceae bacterium]